MHRLGRDNTDMLRLHMEISGKFPTKMLRKGKFAHEHFTEDFKFKQREFDSSDREVVKVVLMPDQPKDLATVLLPHNASKKLNPSAVRINATLSKSPPASPNATTACWQPQIDHIYQLRDLLLKIFILDPRRRITVEEALKHPFVSR